MKKKDVVLDNFKFIIDELTKCEKEQREYIEQLTNKLNTYLVEKWKNIMSYESKDHKAIPEEDYIKCAHKLEEFVKSAKNAGFPEEKMGYVISAVLHSYKDNFKPIFEKTCSNDILPEGLYINK